MWNIEVALLVLENYHEKIEMTLMSHARNEKIYCVGFKITYKSPCICYQMLEMD